MFFMYLYGVYNIIKPEEFSDASGPFDVFLNAPLFLNPKSLLWIDGNVDNPESIVRPVTPIEIGLVLDMPSTALYNCP